MSGTLFDYEHLPRAIHKGENFGGSRRGKLERRNERYLEARRITLS